MYYMVMAVQDKVPGQVVAVVVVVADLRAVIIIRHQVVQMEIMARQGLLVQMHLRSQQLCLLHFILPP